jgi:hypothetical protein
MAMRDPRYPDGYHGWTNRETWATYFSWAASRNLDASVASGNSVPGDLDKP